MDNFLKSIPAMSVYLLLCSYLYVLSYRIYFEFNIISVHSVNTIINSATYPIAVVLHKLCQQLIWAPEKTMTL